MGTSHRGTREREEVKSTDCGKGVPLRKVHPELQRYFRMDEAAIAARSVTRQHFVLSIGQAKPVGHEFEIGLGNHEESMVAGVLVGGRIETRIIWPCGHCGHFRNEQPVRSS